ncbi:hypothetical protein [Nonomuraea sp. NPDC050691]|uniref:hypothetical protein n=1 Tax=Nonomuraea sp. NPDC050691 TaxID=3155661 RepID=UPI0033FC2506
MRGRSTPQPPEDGACSPRPTARVPPSATPPRPACPPGAAPVLADLSRPDSLAAAYAGAAAVVVQLPLVFAADAAMPQAEAVLDALKTARVPRAVFNAGGPPPAAPIGVPFVDARALLVAELPSVVDVAGVTGPAFTYMENLAAPWSLPRLLTGEIVYPLPAELPVPWLALDDLAAAIAALIAALIADPAPPPPTSRPCRAVRRPRLRIRPWSGSGRRPVGNGPGACEGAPRRATPWRCESRAAPSSRSSGSRGTARSPAP